jgi:two-component system response regulator NreC
MSDQKSIDILIVDDDPAVRAGLSVFLKEKPGFHVVGFAEDGQAAFAKIEEKKPTVVLLDSELAGCEGIELGRHIKKQFPSVLLIMLSSDDGGKEFFDSFGSHANGYVSKRDFAHTLEATIRHVGHGSVWLDPRIARDVLQKTTGTLPMLRRDGSVVHMSEALSRQEEKILEKVAQGHCEGGVCSVDPEFLARLHRFSSTHLPKMSPR